MFQFSTARWCERRIGAASGQAGPEVWPSRTHVQNGKRLAAYGDLARIEIGNADHFRFDGDPDFINAIPLLGTHVGVVPALRLLLINKKVAKDANRKVPNAKIYAAINCGRSWAPLITIAVNAKAARPKSTTKPATIILVTLRFRTIANTPAAIKINPNRSKPNGKMSR